MAEKEKKSVTTGSKTKWKAANPASYKESYIATTPEYKYLSEGGAVEIDTNLKFFKQLIEQNILRISLR